MILCIRKRAMGFLSLENLIYVAPRPPSGQVFAQQRLRIADVQGCCVRAWAPRNASSGCHRINVLTSGIQTWMMWMNHYFNRTGFKNLVLTLLDTIE